MNFHVKTNLTIKRIELIINNENELRLFGGKNGFLYAIKCENPDIDQIELYNDYCYIRSILNSIKHNFLSYDRYLKTKHLYPNLKFQYYESRNNNGDLIGVEFKKFNGLILPINHPIWRKIYPPNHINDNCMITNTDEHKNRFLILNKPTATKDFNIDYISLYEKHKNILKSDDPYIRNKPVETVDLGPSLDSLFNQAIYDIYKEHLPNLTEKEIKELIIKTRLK